MWTKNRLVDDSCKQNPELNSLLSTPVCVYRPSLLHVITVTSIAQLTNQSRCSLTKALHKMTKYDHENGTDVVTGGSSAERVRDLRT